MSLPTVAVEVAGATLRLAAGKHEAFYAELAAGRWEPETFAVLRASLDRDTTCIDIGAWIGVTPFYAAQLAKKVVAVEPDPAAFAILAGIREQNAGEVELVNAAVTAAGGGEAVLRAVKRWGSSMSTLLPGAARLTGETARVRTVTLGDLVERAGQLDLKIKKSLVIKIDVEGGEYPLMQSLRQLDPARLRAVLLAMHPQIYIRSLRGPLKRLRAALATWRLLRAVPLARATVPGTGRAFPRLGYVLGAVLFGRPVRGASVLFTAG